MHKTNSLMKYSNHLSRLIPS